MYQRTLEPFILKQLKLGKSLLLLGPRQVGKTTLCKKLKFDYEINLATISEKNKYEKDPELLEKFVGNQKKQLLIYIDEIQKVPQLLNSIQVLIDEKKAQFILTGSSSRKIKQQTDINLAPGRLINLRLDPFSFEECPQNLEDILEFGQLPRIAYEKDLDQKELELRSYVENYVEEEIRKETRLRSIAPFSRFLELAALQSGKISNFSEISKEIGPTIATIQSYYQILEDTLIVQRVDPYLKNPSRKKLTKSSRYLFFDMGVRRITAEEGRKLTPDRKGDLFEHWVGNEIIKFIHSSIKKPKLYFWRDPDGPEVDWLLEYNNHLLPIEVKLNSNPKNQSTKHLKVFMSEYKNAKKALVVCTTSQNFNLDKNVQAISYKNIHTYLKNWMEQT